MALADAGINMKDMVSSVAVGNVDDKIVADLSYKEEQIDQFNPDSKDAPVSDIPIAMIHRTGEISLLQMDGEISKDDLIKSLELAKKASEKVYEVQVKALKAKFEVEK